MRLSTLFEPHYIATVAIVKDGNKLLMGKATQNDERKGKWCFPAGVLNSGEAPEKGAERECFEETGIKCKADQSAIPHKIKPGIAFVICHRVSGDLRPNYEFSELEWIPLGGITNLDDIFLPNLEIIHDLI
jgi:8-oxo-dGTP diphosphatase